MWTDAWFLTWTTYGTWLPGDARGFVGHFRERSGDVRGEDAPPESDPEAAVSHADASEAKDTPSDLRPRLAGAGEGGLPELPGHDTHPVDPRADNASCRVIQNTPGTPYASGNPALHGYAQQRMNGPAVWLDRVHAETVLAEVQRTATFHGWNLLAIAIMANHVHLVIVAIEEISGSKLLQEFKSYGARALNRQFGKLTSGTWWTRSGSARFLTGPMAIESVVDYVKNQYRPLLVWVASEDAAWKTE